MENIKLDQARLLGFKILQQTPKIGGKPMKPATGTTIGGKVGGKPTVSITGTSISSKIGGKIGGKPTTRLD